MIVQLGQQPLLAGVESFSLNFNGKIIVSASCGCTVDCKGVRVRVIGAIAFSETGNPHCRATSWAKRGNLAFEVVDERQVPYRYGKG